MKIILATSNAHKIKEVSQISKTSFEFVPKTFEVEEDGKTFSENAVKKARFAYEHEKIPTVADDSGIEIDALGGLLGIRSARFMKGKPYKEKNAKILEMMKDVLEEKRTARFKCVAVYFDGTPHVFEGVIEGKIAYEQRGENGFGYDPIFIPQGCDKTMAQLSSEAKNSISHRAHAFKKLIEYLKSLPI